MVGPDDDPVAFESGFAGRARGELGVVAEEEESIESELPGQAAEVAVRALGDLSELAHLAEHGVARAGGVEAGQRLERVSHRLRVRVVGVVDHEHVVREGTRLHPARDAAMGGEAFGDGLEGDPRREGPARGGERVVDDRRREPGDLDLAVSEGRFEPEGVGAFVEEAFSTRAEICRGASTEGEYTRLGPVGLGESEGLVAVHDRSSARRERHEKVALLQCDVFARTEELDVGRPHVREDADRGLRDGGEGGDLVSMVHAHLHDGEAVLVAAAQERERHSELVVEVAAGREGRSRDGQDPGAQLLRRGLAIAAGDPDERTLEAFAVAPREGGERRRRVVDVDQEAVGPRDRLLDSIHLYERAGCPAPHHVAEETMCVVIGAYDRDEEIP